MVFSDVEMSILAQLAYRDVDYKPASKEPLSELLKTNREWLEKELGSSYIKYIDKLIKKVDGSEYIIVASNHDKLSGFDAYAISTPDNEVIVACRGTQIKETNDVITDVGLGVELETEQHHKMEEFVNELEKRGYEKYYFTGHSLGGNLATHGAVTVSDSDKVGGVYTYNSPGFNEGYWVSHDKKLNYISNKIYNFQNEYDYVSSLLRSPGKSIVIKSSLEKNHSGLGDHSISAYTIDENGYFQENETGKKHPQTYASTAISDIVNRIFWTSVYRDFSDASKQRLLDLVKQVENDKLCDFTDWVGDRWYDFESWIGVLNIRNYINDINKYHKKVIDQNNATSDTINTIFEEVHKVDAVYGTKFEGIRSSLEQWLQFIVSLTEIVEPGKGNFNGEYVGGILDTVLKDIPKVNIQ